MKNYYAIKFVASFLSGASLVVVLAVFLTVRSQPQADRYQFTISQAIPIYYEVNLDLMADKTYVLLRCVSKKANDAIRRPSVKKKLRTDESRKLADKKKRFMQ